MVVLLLMAAAPAPAPAGEARRVVEAQLKAPLREDAGLSAEEAAVIRQRYLESIGRRVERAVDGAR
ncbi:MULTISPECIES: hypothetical protein [Sphingobium]|uniref:Uncharacterized protein n=2 Tax=Sphingobium fuliginis (strain ATCC 27551) TaxID=336203 RepID=A0A292ZLT0_SPHSA|nr:MULTISPECIES: hypothetical protein [Sphingobium]AJR23700.1 hypothetical protein TZ53_08195 [Sphingobium sp. YBL2]QDC39469.1 hypothetical protein FIL70_19815 [Sphingobium fuliginis ATCC 27551]GAY23924.1 hypothetical protein SFOMI_4502 [Sphingobium fuliginis]